jgi:hypothetical protein
MRIAGALIALAAVGCDSKSAAMDGGGGVPDAFETSSFDLGCASSGAQAKLIPVNLVVLLDRSGSLGDGINGDPTLKWNPITQAMEAFFADPKSLGMSASLAFFPSANDECNPSVYYTPAVPMRPLPEQSAFTAAINAVKPMGDTPTLPAIQGAIDYAKDTAAATPGSHTAIVLVTDGDPSACNSSVQNVSQQAGLIASSIPTYVIGIGASLSSLNMIAQSGGTTMATLVSVGNAAQTSADFQAALEAIRGLQLSCDFPLPQPPAGMVLDFHAVNVVFTPSTGAKEELLYSNDCSKTGFGWRYDDPKNPTKVELCPASCDQVKMDSGGRIDVVFGCATDGAPIL